MKNTGLYLFLIASLITISSTLSAQNPIIRDQFSADPSARVFNGKVYVFPSHDILANENRGRVGWFCMADYHVFSSSNLVDWTDHGVIVSQDKVEWVNPNSYSMWAPDCIEKDGKYYFYFPTAAKDTSYGRGFMIGVAVAEKPEGPYIPETTPIKDVHGIDPNVFIDKDGQPYLIWSMRGISVAKLKDNMVELASEPKRIDNLPQKGLIEGPYMFERNGIYYMTYPHVENNTERLEYAIGDNPFGPFEVKGVIMDESPTGCWTNHHSFIEYNDQWYLFYHHNDYSPSFDKSRSVRMDSMFFNPDGTIQKVIPTLRGVGLMDATKKIEIDRFSAISENGINVSLHDTTNTFQGWKTEFGNKNAWLKYNAVDFGNKKIKSIQVRASSPKEAVLQIRLDNKDGVVLSEIKVPAGEGWNLYDSKIKTAPKGVQNLIFTMKSDNPVAVDWVRFME